MSWPRFSGFHTTPNDARLDREGDLWVSYERSYFSIPDQYGLAMEHHPSTLHALIVVGDAKDLAPVRKAAERVMAKRTKARNTGQSQESKP